MHDVVVVGAGSAGSALAARLTEDPGTSVLLIEAGPPARRPEVHIPAAYPQLFRSRLDWNYSTQTEPHLDGRQIYWPRGRVVGGCSAMNAMIYMRGAPEDYDQWAALGNTGWAWKDVLPLFLASEDNERGPSAFHGAGGPLRVSDQVSRAELSHAFVAAAQEWGLPFNDDFNGRQQVGAGFFQVTQRDGRRESAARAFLRPARRRPNLTTVTGAAAERVLFSGRRAIGVRCRTGRGRRDFLGNEVVLCAGAIGSPHLLLLSGVGPAQDLERLDIPLLMNSPGVGGNLQDHASLPVVRASGVRSLGTAPRLPNLLRYAATRRGPFASNIVEAGAFVRTENSLAAPDLQLHFAPVLVNGDAADPTEDGFVVWSSLLTPESRGRIRLASSNPATPPLIRAGYLSTRGDVERTVQGLRWALDLCDMPALSSRTSRAVLPGTSDEDLVAYARANLATLYHPVGTCAMGDVVDSQLRVLGLEGLRVADASVMPTIPRGNTNAPAIMIGEMAARLLRAG